MNYDQWKTASPWDDAIDWAELGVACPECDGDPEEQDNDGERVELWCPDCGHVFYHKYDNEVMI